MEVTIKDIARIAGVSYSTVSKALNNSPLVKEGTKRKVLDIANQMGYHPNMVAKSLVSKKSNTIGVVWPSVDRTVWSNLATIINEKLKAYSYHMLLSINPVESAVSLFNQLRVDAILVFGNDNQLDSTFSSIPILDYGPCESYHHPIVNVNRRQAILKAVEHLYQLGHRKIAYIGDLSHKSRAQQEKYIGFTEGIMKFSLPSNPNMAIDTQGHGIENGYQAVHKLLASSYQATGVICGSYEITIGVIKAIKDAGLSIPENISIVSYDNIPQMETLEIPVTAVGFPIDKVAECIVESLLCLIDGTKIHPSLNEEPPLIKRLSTASPSKTCNNKKQE